MAKKRNAQKKPVRKDTPLRAPSNRIAERNAMLAARARENLEKAIKSKSGNSDSKGKKKADVKKPSNGGGNGKKGNVTPPPPGFPQLPFVNGNMFNMAGFGGQGNGNGETGSPATQPPPGFMYQAPN